MTKLKPGDIVRRVRGHTPMVVLAATSTRQTVRVAYCSLYHEGRSLRDIAYKPDVMELVSSEFKLVTSLSEFAKCNNWRKRMTPEYMDQLMRQVGMTDDNQEGTEEMAKLYQTNEATPRFGTLLATNSAGLYVLEMKGTGEVLTFGKKDVEEVKPYTVRVQFVSGSGDYDFLSRKGDVEVGELLLIKGYDDMARVKAIDTKSDKARVELVGRKVVTAPFGPAVTE